MKIDIHVHVGSFPSIEGSGHLLRSRADVASFRSRHPEAYARYVDEAPLDNATSLLAAMDRHGIDVALIQPRPGITNGFVAEMAKGHPERLIPLALPTPWPTPGPMSQSLPEAVPLSDDPPTRLLELARHCLDDLGMTTLGELYVRNVTGRTNPEAIADDFSPLLELVARAGGSLQIPTAWTQFPGGLHYGDPLWVDELAARFPGVPIVLTKMGRGLTRFFESSLVVALRNHNVYFDTSHTTVEHLRRALEAIGPERIMYGSDWSATWQFMDQPASVHEVAHQTVVAATSDTGVQRQVLGDTAAAVYARALGRH